MDIPAVVEKQRAFFRTGKSKEASVREETLRKLADLIRGSEAKLFEALRADLGKCVFESYLGEVGICLSEVRFALKHLDGWMRPRRVPTPINLFPGRSYLYPDPYGVCLIMAPWNYPFNLLISPLIGAVAAGNCAVLKPSELAPHTSKAAAELINANFDPGHIAVVEGGVSVNQALLALEFDKIFFTGSTAVGKIVMKAAAEFLTPVTLELGGKSPCVVDEDADIGSASKRIAWGKFLNAGQTCVAPDYILAHESVKEPLVAALKERIREFYGEDAAKSPDYPRIINDGHFGRIKGLLEGQKIAQGGSSDAGTRYIEPTLVDEPRWDAPIMKEEIFGPLLPVLGFTDLGAAIEKINDRPKPLALYYFGGDSSRVERVLTETSSGGSCVNETVMHLANENLPFGGVGPSGMGSYHGKGSFDAFTHYKSVLKRPSILDNPLRYAPYEGKLKFLRFFVN